MAFLGDLQMEKLAHEKGMQAENRAGVKNCQPIIMVFEMIYYKFHRDLTSVDYIMAMKNMWKTCRQFFTPTVCSQPACLSPTSMSSPKKPYLLRRLVQLQELALYCAMAKMYLVTIVVPFV